MTLTQRNKYVRNMTEDEYKKCVRLNFRQGSMDYMLQRNRKDPNSKARVSMIIDENELLIGWGLMFYNWNAKTPTIYLYTRAKWRNKGIASRLLRALKKQTKYKPYICPHDPKSGHFYKKFNKETKVGSGYSYRDALRYA